MSITTTDTCFASRGALTTRSHSSTCSSATRRHSCSIPVPARLTSPLSSAKLSSAGFKSWPDEIVNYDLGGRTLDVIPIPGHEQTSIAVYDRQTGVLFTGDPLYPGRLYVEDPPRFARSVRRMVEFTRGKVVARQPIRVLSLPPQ